MADLASTRVFGRLTVMHEAILQANAEIIGNLTVGGMISAASYEGLPITATRWPTFEEVTGKPTVYPAEEHQHTLSQITDAGNVAAINTTGSTANYLRGDGTWVKPPNNTYSVMSTAEIDAGTSSTGRLLSAARVKYLLDKKADAEHSHDSRYYTKAELDAQLGDIGSLLDSINGV